ncbi:MAG TPA: serine/threonine-protein kinase, partial [Planctomycetota bacterium]|nr:serine/threonine-protein kinase [Planctomycetota bacterium]
MPPQQPAPGSPGEPGRQFGHYELLKELGRGAQGVVHLAEDTRLRRQVALKMLTTVGARSAEARSRFQKEAAMTSKIQHPGICGVYEVGEVDGVPFIAMQFVRGVTLADLLVQSRGEQDKPKSTDTISFRGTTTKGELQDLMRLIERAARALHQAHEVGLVHRDIKPANIMVTPDGDPVLLDFGLARDVGSEGAGLTQSGQIMGTPAYLAPEQIVAERGGVDRRADVYALGVTLFECLTMKRPYDAPSWDQLFHKILAGSLSNCRKLNPRIPHDLRTVIEVAMDREPAKRYATAEQFADDLRRVRSFEPIKARAAGPLQRVVKWSRRHPGRAASLLSGVLAVVLGGGALLLAEWNRRAAVEDNLQLADRKRATEDFDAALAAVARALERDPESLRARELKTRVEQERATAANDARRQQASAAAEAARVESRAAQATYTQLQERIDQERREIAATRPKAFDTYAEATERAALAARERRLRGMEQESLQLLIRAQEALDRAARLEQEWGGPSAVTEAERASFFLSRWREATARADGAAAAAFRAAVEYHDTGGKHRSELLGRGNLQIDVEPRTASVHLFRYESYETVRTDDVIPRLVPVPTRGVGRAREGGYAHGFVPGDSCL